MPRLDEAIDRAVRDLTAHEAPADLRERVLARLEEPAPVGAWWSPGRLAATAAAVAALAVAAYLAWPSRPAPLDEPESVVAQARPQVTSPSERPARVETAPPEATAAERGTATAPRAAAATARTAAATAVAEPEPYEFTTPRLVEPLEEPPPLVIEPLAEPRLAIEPITIDRLTFEPIVIDPLRMGY